MDKKAVRGWVMYDWANSAFATTMLATVLPIFYRDVAGSGLDETTATSLWGYMNSLAMLSVVLMIPVLGAVSDMTGLKMRFLRLFAYAGMAASACFLFVGEGDIVLASVLFIIGSAGFYGGNVFYDSLITDLAPLEKRDMLSSQGYAFGYIGGGILLAVNLAMIEGPQWFGFPDTLTATRAVFISVAVWWFVFSLPLFLRVKNRPATAVLKISQYASVGFGRIWATARRMKQYPELLKYLFAYWFFNDGINTVIIMAAAYGSEIGIGTSDLIKALLITQFVGIPFTLLFGKIAERAGSKRSLYISLSVYVVVICLGYFMESAWQFYALAILVGCVQGGSQSIARSIYSGLIPAERSAEFFSFLSISGKFASIIGPAVFGIVGQLTGSSRFGIVSLILFFAAGIILLTRVDLDKGQRQVQV